MLGLILASTLAVASEVGVGLSGVAVHKSSGWYTWKPAFDLWWGVDVDETWTGRLVVQAGLPARHEGEQWSYVQLWEQVAVVAGWRGGTGPAEVFAEVGPALTWVSTTWTMPDDVRVHDLRGGARVAAGMRLGSDGQWLAALHASNRGSSLDFGLGVGWGVCL